MLGKYKMNINNRRYIGNKFKLLEFIYSNVIKFGFDNKYTFLDLFAGTGVVANFFANKGYKTIINDNLYSNKVIYETFLGKDNIDYKKIKKILSEYNIIDESDIEDNYFSQIYANKYFSINDSKKIGYIRDEIENIKDNLSYREYCYLISSLLYSADKIANTVGHFESFLKKEPIDKGVLLKEFKLNENIKPADIYNEDANDLAKKIKADVVYIDPPYNARQYVNFYHVLENLARWEKPQEFEGNSMKFKRDNLKSGYCRKNKASTLFKDLINSLQCKLIVVSYNNTYEAKSESSNNTILPNEIISILESKGNVHIKEREYKSFNAGKTNLDGHKEFIYICEVNNEYN